MSALSSFFANRVAVIATMHRKEDVITPLIESALGIKTVVPTNFNTDHFGTFTRETERPADQLTTARLKAEAALRLTGETLAIASEGSFGPHPQIPFVACNRELVLLCDYEHQIEVVGEALSTDTNYQSRVVDSPQSALAFARSVGFPEHGVVVMHAAGKNPKNAFAKGITTEADLSQAVTAVLERSPEQKAHVETDMRALYNPTRMAVIAQATQNLIETLQQRCPNCDYPGFSIVQRRPGLPCSLCKAPTLLTLSVLYRCQHCQFQRDKLFPDSLQTADPGRCLYCNP